MTWVRLLKSHTNERGRKFPIGKVLNYLRDHATDLVNNGTAEFYHGPFPPVKKKIDFFKPNREVDQVVRSPDS